MVPACSAGRMPENCMAAISTGRLRRLPISLARSTLKPWMPPSSLGMACGAKVPSTAVFSGCCASASPGRARTARVTIGTKRMRILQQQNGRDPRVSVCSLTMLFAGQYHLHHLRPRQLAGRRAGLDLGHRGFAGITRKNAADVTWPATIVGLLLVDVAQRRQAGLAAQKGSTLRA